MPEPLHHPELIPPADLAICFGGGDFRQEGRQIVDLMQAHGLAAQHRVLDIGCGAGRLAHALLPVLGDRGTYAGFDIFPAGVEWCAQHYPPRFPNFRFQHAPVYNRLYYPYGAIPPAEFVFPYPDASFDFAAAASVFTHMLPEEVAHYLGQVRRVLAPGGVAVATFFLLDDATAEAVAAGRTNPAFPRRYGPVRVADPQSPEDAVAYDEHFARALFAAAGGAIARTTRGSWRGAPGQGYQDALVAVFA